MYCSINQSIDAALPLFAWWTAGVRADCQSSKGKKNQIHIQIDDSVLVAALLVWRASLSLSLTKRTRSRWVEFGLTFPNYNLQFHLVYNFWWLIWFWNGFYRYGCIASSTVARHEMRYVEGPTSIRALHANNGQFLFYPSQHMQYGNEIKQLMTTTTTAAAAATASAEKRVNMWCRRAYGTLLCRLTAKQTMRKTVRKIIIK